jgi:hypothetical protein
MSKPADEAIQEAAKGFAAIPEDHATVRKMKIKDSILDQNDWDEFNKRLCDALETRGGKILQGQLNPFWVRNDPFSAMIDYVDARCGF